MEEYNINSWSTLTIGTVDLHLPDTSKEKIEVELYQKGIQCQIIISDIQALIDLETINSLEIKASGKGSIFLDYQDAATYIEYLASKEGTEVFSIGKTYLGEDIKGVKFGRGSKSIVLNGGIHAREWIAPAVVNYVADFLLGSDSKAIQFRAEFTFYIIPVLNVDGYAFTRLKKGGDRLWRKNRQPNASSKTCIGTDPNRNFDFSWGMEGASASPCQQDYRGESAHSAKETFALQDFVSKLPNVVSYFDFHAYSQLWMFAFSYKCANIPEVSDLQAASDLAVAAIKSSSNLTYTAGPVCSTIYRASGTTVDFMYEELGVKYAAAVELRDTGRNGFILPAEQIIPTGKEIVAGLIAFWDYALKHPL